LLIERSGLGGQAGITVGLDNFPGFPEGISGQEFSERVTQQARRFGVEILQAVDVERMEMEEGYHEVYTSDGKHYHSKAILIATGASYKRLEVPGEDDYIGAGIHFCATCDGPFYKGAREIVVIGGGNSAVEEGLHLTNFADKVTLLVRGDRLTASQIAIDKVNEPNSHVEVKYNTVVEAIEGQDSKLKTIKYRFKDSDQTEEIHPAAAFIFIGQTPNTGFLKDYIALDKYGFALTGHDIAHGKELMGMEPLPFEASVSGIFVAGDARHGSTKQVASAVGEGAAASISIREFLRRSQ
jgi:thioredoxin reductase (NADPH)